jgi:hypothetical protein
MIPAEQLKELLPGRGGCIASNKITVDRELVHYMYREEPDFKADSGWRFMSGSEDQEYADDHKNWKIYELNTFANYDPSIIPYMDLPIGTALEKIAGTSEFQVVEE